MTLPPGLGLPSVVKVNEDELGPPIPSSAPEPVESRWITKSYQEAESGDLGFHATVARYRSAADAAAAAEAFESGKDEARPYSGSREETAEDGTLLEVDEEFQQVETVRVEGDVLVVVDVHGTDSEAAPKDEAVLLRDVLLAEADGILAAELPWWAR